MRTRLAFGIAAPLFLLLAVFLVPHEIDDQATTQAQTEHQLAIVAAHQPAAYIGFICIMLGLFATGFFGWHLSRLATGRAALVARIGGWMVLVGGIGAGLANLLLGAMQSAAAQPGLDRSAAAAQLLKTESGSLLAPFFLPYVVGLVGGGLVLTVGLVISRPVPWWLGLVAGLTIVAVFFASAGPTGLVTTLIMAAAFILAARWPERRSVARPTGSVQLAEAA